MGPSPDSLGGPAGHSQLSARLVDLATANGDLLVPSRLAFQRRFKLLPGCLGIDAVRRLGPSRHHGDFIVRDLDKTALDIVESRLVAMANPQLATPQPANERAMPRSHTSLTIKQWQRDKIGPGVEHGIFGGNNHHVQIGGFDS